MAEFQKYMFDNFVVPNDNEPVIDEPQVMTTSENEAAQDLPSSENTDTMPEEVVAEATVEPMPPAAPEPEIKAEPTVSFSHEELDAEVKKAEERGYEKGFQVAQSEKEQRQSLLLTEISGKLQELLDNAAAVQTNLEAEQMSLSVELVRKLLPTLEKTQAQAEVKKFLADNFVNFRKEPSLSFSFNPEVVAQMPEVISKLASQNDFEGKIAIHKDANLALTDCRVEWLNGGVERNNHKMLEKMSELFDDKTMNEKEREHG